MIVKDLQLENFRGFEKAHIQFDKQLNVFIGNNGAGKTSILEAVVKCLSACINELRHLRDNQFELQNKDINYNNTHCFIRTELDINTEFIFPIGLQYYLHFGNISPKDLNDLYDVINLRNTFSSNRQEAFNYFFNDTLSIPILKFYSSSKTNLNFIEPSSEYIHNRPQLEVWDNIYHNNLTYSKFLTWFFDYETLELRQKRDQGDLNAELPVLKVIRTVIKRAFQQLKAKNLLILSNKIKREGSNDLIPSLVLQEEGSNKKLDISSMSDGEKAIITLISDIAYNLAISNPEGKTVEEILSSNGVVLIDEIDAHLHPTWQREIIPLLLNLFPEIQFFVTTHSPQIIASVNSEHVFICDNFEVSQLNFKSKGLDSNSILKYIFNSTDRPKEYEILLMEFDQLMDSNANVEELYKVLTKISAKDKEDNKIDTSQLVNELEIRLEAYKFDLEHEKDH